MEADTASLRNAAPQWSLAGDKQLLDILQNIHQSLMTRCQEVNRKLDEMVTALDDASVDLQNVNNKFMALSNTQFIESRVYDDDTDVASQEKPKEEPKVPSSLSELELLKQSVRVLESMHEPIQILDSDSDSDTDDEVIRTVLKPKDLYSDRPLPHIIGSAAWRNKWHAGLLPEDSDSDSSTSKPERDLEQYSDSEPERTENAPSELRAPHMQESPSSSEVTIEQDVSSPAPPKPSPADVAAELARRLGQTPQVVHQSDYSPATPTTNKIYRPEKPSAATIFSDEPPPLNQYQSEGEEYSQDEDDDIFAEFHKNTPQQPQVHSNREQSRLADDLFSGLSKEEYGESDIFNDFKDPEPSPPTVAKQKSTLFEDESEPELFAAKPINRQTPKEDDTKTEPDGVKKPVGAISLFGSNKGAESIGAAILKRNRRKSSSEENSIEEDAPKPVKNVEKLVKNTEKDIFDDLFAKSEKEQKVAATNKNKETVKVVNEVKSEKKVDLFSDNIFDDIDDIFTTDVSKVTVKESNKNQKSLFDDDDDLFSDIAVTKSEKPEAKSKNNEKKSLFDSDDDLFSEKPVKNVENKESHNNRSDENISSIKSAEVKQTSKSRSIFDDDSSDNDIFSNLAENCKTSVISNEIAKSEVKTNVTESQLKKEQNPKTESITNSRANIFNNVKASTSKMDDNVKSQSLFDDNEDDDIFNKKSSIDEKPEFSSSVRNNEQNKNIESKNKTSIFDDNDDDIFASKSLLESRYSNKVISVSEKSINNDFKDNELLAQSDKNSFNSEPKDFLFVDRKSDDVLYQTNEVVKQDIKEIEQQQKAAYDQENEEQNQKHFSTVENKSADIPSLESTKENNSSISDDVTNPVNKEVKSNQLDANLDDSFKSFETKPESKSIFDDVLEDELFNQEQTPDKYITKPQLPDYDQIDKNKYNNENEALFSSPNESLFNTSSVISNIIDDEPPAFEKPKEPKRSKNVNALFDDDSDDEALFFKKNDALCDEKPEINTDSNNDALFDIFHDEPPAIDVDFVQKTAKQNLNDDFLKTDDDLFTEPKTIEKESSKPSIASKPSQTLILEKELPEFEVLQNKNDTLSESSKIPDKTTKVDTTKSKIDKLESLQKSDVLDGSNEPKKIGKLKTMNLNINVNTLLPGASPKKKQIIEQTDGQVLLAKSQEDLHCKEKIKEIIEPVMTKSVSFEGEPDSKVLDNQISKRRAKIQVKRRPSTRRARQEAVRKSAIDFSEDSTDNSSSIDDPKPKVETVNTCKNDELDTKEIKNEIIPRLDEVAANINISIDFESNIDTIETSSQPIIHEITEKVGVVENNKIESINIPTTTIQTLNETKYKNKTKETLNEPHEIITKEIEPKTHEIKDVKSKIVYILNDEDIFNTGVEKTIETKQVLSVEDDEGLFKNTGNISKDELPSISTLGNVYKETSKAEEKGSNSKAFTDNNSEFNKPKKSLFDDLSDDEQLFNNKKVKSKGILDSDSEEDLFGGKSKKDTMKVSVKETKDVKPKVEVKASLFDDDDDDDLFGVKVKNTQANTSQPSQSTSKEVLPKSTEPVFDDPLSLLGDSDD